MAFPVIYFSAVILMEENNSNQAIQQGRISNFSIGLLHRVANLFTIYAYLPDYS
jgi:hypothetical protein